ncbi:MAG: hypothetical protein EXR71_18905 [Myxococcales bacterium]|nr:hypothetical protein [Myxococcales bacterium]
MRLVATSDIHIDKNGPEVLALLGDRIARLAPDVLVVAGDVATSPTVLLQSLLALRKVSPRVMFLAGNHDVWGHPTGLASGQHAWWRLDHLLPALCAEAGVDNLDAGGVEVDGIGFVGTLGWYDLSMKDEALGAPDDAYASGEYAGMKWMDHVYAVFPGPDGRPLPCQAVAAVLRGRLAAQLAATTAPRVVGVTHMVPFAEQLYRKDHPGWRFCQAFIGHRGLGEVLLSDPRVELAIAGHTHRRSDLRIGGLRALCTPLGYRREWIGMTDAEAVAAAVTLVEI